MKKTKDVKVIALGGLGEVGRNMTLIEYEQKILIIDFGLRFPEETMPGIDFIIPNTAYLKGREKDIVGAVITHGHLDHIGAIPYLSKKLHNPTIYAPRLSRGLIMKRQKEFPDKNLNLKSIKDGDHLSLPPFKIEPFRQNHSIPENLGMIIDTPAGRIVHTSDFKFDSNPVNDIPTDFKKLKKIGESGVLLLMSDSTGAEDTGHSISEKEIEKNLEEIFKKSRKGRIIAGTFASLLNRIQQIITLSEKYGRKVCVEGYSMKNYVEIAKSTGYMKIKEGTLISAKELEKYPDSQVTIVCTGAQGEGQAILMRIANKEHRIIRLKKGDNIIFSSSVIPGNERSVQALKDEFYRQGIKVFHYKMMDIHAGGHGKEEELREMIRLMKPKFLMPVHGQFSMLVSHSEIAKSEGILESNIIVAENGQVISLSDEKFSIAKKPVPSNYVMVDGLGVGDVGEVVLRDRQVLSKDGMFVIIAVIDRQAGKVKGSPDIISRGFIYLRESKDLLSQTRQKVIEIINKSTGGGEVVNLSYVKDEIRNKVGNFLYSKTKRRPMVLPVVIEV
ncbi:MAG: ribonuclease J [Candidatus Pacebacteria bacterium]|nr:ribonuclease J [Candidatus Paceibacterota bacterium]MDD4201776.1 ribonuclease J [Candidatus Paceibacterota bacterium]MDD4897614.1 ribonuclease J [Candidatus Paceibacterota bacterium]